MITIHPDTWLAQPTIAAIAVATCAVSAVVTRRWHWTALLLAALSALLVPVAVVAAVMAVLQWGLHYGEDIAFAFFADSDIFLVGLASALVGFVGSLLSRGVRTSGG